MIPCRKKIGDATRLSKLKSLGLAESSTWPNCLAAIQRPSATAMRIWRNCPRTRPPAGPKKREAARKLATHNRVLSAPSSKPWGGTTGGRLRGYFCCAIAEEQMDIVKQ